MTEIWALTAEEMAAGVKSGEMTARGLAEATLARIDAANGPLNAVVARFDDEALAAADAVDAAWARGETLGPLAGVPVTVKVNVDQQGQATTNGLRKQAGLIAEDDNPVVANLRKAGAVIVGRTNTPAFSLRWFTRNSLHGHTRNPLNPALTPGGSSGGASAAVAAGMAPIGHGNDIAGSVRYPAYACGIHGLRPSFGRVPAYNGSAGDRPIGGQLMSTQGPLARSIGDLRLALAAMAAPDTRDPWWMPVPLTGPEAPRRAALCLAPDGMAVAPEVKAALRAAADKLAAAGWQVEEVAPPPIREAQELQLRLWLADFRRSAGMVAAEDDPDANFVYAQLCRLSPEIDRDALLDTLQARARLVRLWRGFFERTPLLLCPVSGELPFADLRDVASEADFDAIIEAQMTMIGLPFMGLPGLTVTTGRAEGPLGPAPVGVQLVAAQFREDILLEAGELLGPTVPALA
ncbi:amidase [Acidimangrovimonas pyrenivorans]|uniref:Amidase n=1 Tax=Acidimangrovimonas pyrenivorans TaxID=2030798 RepID=A0ABV7AFT4_9RHOB